MENHPRRRRGRPRANANQVIAQPAFAPRSNTSSFFDNLCSFLILSSLLAIIYLLLEHHCTVCKSKCDVYSITKGLNDINHNLTDMKNSYTYLESRILKFSEELPKIEGQVEILEALANTLERGDIGWNPKKHLALPNVDVYLNSKPNRLRKNYTNSFESTKSVKVNVD
ncbi:unnamed protein product [Leptosia nina]|uniref:Uncharacterized protein n=1 Tax=Leptosia nina TaxID=320188 RepID=A0AAV1JED4_9NEOP